MTSQAIVCDTFSLSGAPLERLRQALEVDESQARVARNGESGRLVEDTVMKVDEILGTLLPRMKNAGKYDEAVAEEQGGEKLARWADFSRYQAA
jgi:hypothetical protein